MELVRVVAGLVAALVMPAAILSLVVFHNPIWGLGAAVVAAPVAIPLGVGIYYLLRRRLAPTRRNAMAVGALITGALAAASLAASQAPPDEVLYGFVTATDGAFTFAGRAAQAIAVAAASCVGAGGGFVFWWVVVPRRRPSPRAGEPPRV